MTNTLIKLLEKYPNKPWRWTAVSYNCNITFEYVITHLNLPWNWNALSQHKNITFKHILDHPDLPWSW